MCCGARVAELCYSEPAESLVCLGPDLLLWPLITDTSPLTVADVFFDYLSLMVSLAQTIPVSLICSVSVKACIFLIKDNLVSNGLTCKTKE